MILAQIHVVCLLFSLYLSPILGQAPGDEDDSCIKEYSDTVMNLMESSNYEYLLPGNGTGNSPIPQAVWNDMSYDGNDETNKNNPTYWQPTNSLCNRGATVCGWRFNGVDAPQDNWLFTQHIHRNFDAALVYPVEIQVEISYRFNLCRKFKGCEPYFTLHKYLTNEVQLPSKVGSGFMNRQNYDIFANITTGANVTTSVTLMYSFILQPSQTGFYIAIRDNGTCVSVANLHVYRHNCQSQQNGLVLYPDAPAPVSDSVNINIQCMENADISGSAQVTCGSDGRWGPQNPVCQCRLGYEDRGTECVACPAGEYRSADDSTCQQCPDNTVRDQVAAPLCECLDGYFRNTENNFMAQRAQPYLFAADEHAGTECTQPPSAPRNMLLTPQATSIMISWTQPAEDGGRSDLFYRVDRRDSGSLGQYSGIEYLSGSSTSYTMTSLRPFREYCIRVTAHNGVSDQDPDGTHLRTEERCTNTLQKEPGPVKDLISIYPSVLWQVPQEPNGIILDYQLTFTRNGQTTVASTNGPETYFIVRPELLPEGSGSFQVEVKARNGIGSGEVLCKLSVDPEACGSEPQRCLVCPEQTVGQVRYPATAAPADGSVVTVTTQCVENAEQSSPSLSVTCTSSGEWGSENPECKCVDDYTLDIETGECIGIITPIEPTLDPPQCPSGCSGNCECPDTGGLSTEDEDCPSLIVAVVIACVATGLLVALVATVISIMVVVCIRKKMAGSSTKTSGSYDMKENHYNT